MDNKNGKIAIFNLTNKNIQYKFTKNLHYFNNYFKYYSLF